jgi:hypothetical protein
MKNGSLPAEPELHMAKDAEHGSKAPTFDVDDEHSENEDEAPSLSHTYSGSHHASKEAKPAQWVGSEKREYKKKKRGKSAPSEKPNLTLEGDDFFDSG